MSANEKIYAAGIGIWASGYIMPAAPDAFYLASL